MPKLPQSILVAGCAIALVGLCTAVLPDGASTTTASTAHPLVFVHGSRLAVQSLLMASCSDVRGGAGTLQRR